VSSSSINKGPDEFSAGTAQSGAAEPTKPGFARSIGLPTAIAINMTQMCGIGPFITIPLMVAAFGGPQAILGWVYVYYASGLVPILLSLAWVAAGVVAYLLWARFVEHTWPFGPKEIKEEYLEHPEEAGVSA
jgi:hypothetical protein